MELPSCGPAVDWPPSAYWVQNGGAPWSLSAGRRLFRFEVRAGDHWPGDPAGSGKERSELAVKSTFAFGRSYRIHYQFKVEPGRANTAEWLVLGQIHQTDDPGVQDASPPVEVELNGERMSLVVRWASWPLTEGARPVSRTLWSDPAAIRRGRWYDMVIDARFDPFGDGVLQVHRDGRRLADYRGPLGFANRTGPYWKEGLYRSAAPESLAAVFRNLSIAEQGAVDAGGVRRAQPDPARDEQGPAC